MSKSSDFARKQLEKFGWSKGDGLGANKTGVSTYIRVERRTRDDVGGLGHNRAAKPNAHQESYDEILAAVGKAQPNEAAQNAKRSRVPETTKMVAETSASSDSEGDDGPTNTTVNDKELFERCGGVRLGRCGRHRFFNGKLARIEASNAPMVADKAQSRRK